MSSCLLYHQQRRVKLPRNPIVLGMLIMRDLDSELPKYRDSLLRVIICLCLCSFVIYVHPPPTLEVFRVNKYYIVIRRAHHIYRSLSRKDYLFVGSKS